MIQASSMGPGFFIFFQETEILGGSGYPVVIVYDDLPVKTVKEVVKKVKKYKKAKRQIDPEAVQAIVESMVDKWPKYEMKAKMEDYGQTEELALLSYRETLRQIVVDDDLAIIFILASL